MIHNETKGTSLPASRAVFSIKNKSGVPCNFIWTYLGANISVLCFTKKTKGHVGFSLGVHCTHEIFSTKLHDFGKKVFPSLEE